MNVDEDHRVEIHDVNGVLQLETEVSSHIDVSMLSSGLYLIRVKDQSGNVYAQSRLIKK